MTTCPEKLDLGASNTPIERLDTLSTPSCSLWIKRDDLGGTLYGGNKVRKLELLLADAKRSGATHVATVGAAGSHHVLATTLYARSVGLGTHALLFPQHDTPHARANLADALANGLVAWPLASPIAWQIAREPTRWSEFVPELPDLRALYIIPLGGSSPLGALAFVDAAREMAEQLSSMSGRAPDVVVAALGSGGTVAGLACGIVRVGLSTQVVGVNVSKHGRLQREGLRILVARTARLAGVPFARAWSRISLREEFAGDGYGVPSPGGARARELADHAGISLDATYTEKAFAAALDITRAGTQTSVLFWHTLSRPMPRSTTVIPKALEVLFQPNAR